MTSTSPWNMPMMAGMETQVPWHRGQGSFTWLKDAFHDFSQISAHPHTGTFWRPNNSKLVLSEASESKFFCDTSLSPDTLVYTSYKQNKTIFSHNMQISELLTLIHSYNLISKPYCTNSESPITFSCHISLDSFSLEQFLRVCVLFLLSWPWHT